MQLGSAFTKVVGRVVAGTRFDRTPIGSESIALIEMEIPTAIDEEAFHPSAALWLRQAQEIGLRFSHGGSVRFDEDMPVLDRAKKEVNTILRNQQVGSALEKALLRDQKRITALRLKIDHLRANHSELVI